MKKLLLLLLLINVNLQINASLFLQAPQALTTDDIKDCETKIKQDDMFFTWRFSKFHGISYFIQNQKPGFVLWVAGTPVYSYNFISLHSLKKAGLQLKNSFTELFAETKKVKHAYKFTTPLEFTDPRPVKIDFDDLCHILKDKTFIFYTGAGLSAASGVPTMPALQKALKIDLGVNVWLKAAIKNPEELANNFGNFASAALNAMPTPAHYAIAKISQVKHLAILTENIDLLQHKTGVAPEFVRSDKIYEIKQADYLAINYLVCVGLSHDDCGFIAQYKAHNPAGKIVALDLNVPNYLSANDYLLQADLQIILPNLAQQLLT